MQKLNKITASRLLGRIVDYLLLQAANTEPENGRSYPYDRWVVLSKNDIQWPYTAAKIGGSIGTLTSDLAEDFGAINNYCLESDDPNPLDLAQFHVGLMGGTVAERVRIGARIRELRESQGYDILDLAERASIKPENLHRIEAGKYNCTANILAQIAEALEKKIDFV